jgi:hypothetical protein
VELDKKIAKMRRERVARSDSFHQAALSPGSSESIPSTPSGSREHRGVGEIQALERSGVTLELIDLRGAESRIDARSARACCGWFPLHQTSVNCEGKSVEGRGDLLEHDLRSGAAGARNAQHNSTSPMAQKSDLRTAQSDLHSGQVKSNERGSEV